MKLRAKYKISRPLNEYVNIIFQCDIQPLVSTIDFIFFLPFENENVLRFALNKTHLYGFIKKKKIIIDIAN